MTLLHNLDHREYQSALAFSKEKCEVIAELAGLKISFEEVEKPGELLIKRLYRAGFSAKQYKELLGKVKTRLTYYKPQSKVAILIANDRYEQLSKLATPSVDCDSLGANLKSFGFIVVMVKNTVSSDLKRILTNVFTVTPEDSYCFIFYAGHGCDLCNTKCMLSINCPAEDIEMKHCVTKNFVLSEVAKCKPDLCVLIMDMCSIYLDRATNPKIYSKICDLEDYTIHKNLMIAYSAQSSEAAYEVLQLECTVSSRYGDSQSTSSDLIKDDDLYQLKKGDTGKILPGSSQYVNALITRIGDDFDISTLLDQVHGDVENSVKEQRPIKIQCGVAKRSLYDPSQGDTPTLLTKIKEVTESFSSSCVAY